MRRMTTMLVVTILAATLALATGCGSDVPRGGFHGSEGGDDWEADFGVWDGSETRDLDVAGEQSIQLSYRTRIEEGMVTFVMRNDRGESIWDLSSDGEIEDTEEIPLPDPGDYTVTAYGTRATGDFRLSWKTR